MLKKKIFKIEDSNVENIGSAEDKAARYGAAATETAWKNAGQKPGLEVWRIEKFKVTKSMTAAGTFYDDDSYICLNTYKCKDMNGKLTDKLGWDIHFWLGQTTTQDEYGTAAYKTVELDDFLGGGPVQHREVSGHESNLFCSYFKESGGIRLLQGGMDSGFNRVKPTEYRPKLLHLKGRKNIRVVEVPIENASLNSGDVFILDNGMDIYQWQGSSAGMNEKARAGQLCRAIDDERGGKPEVHVYRQGDADESEFFAFFKDSECSKNVSDEAGDDSAWEKKSDKCLFQLSDASGTIEFTEVATKVIKRSMLNSDDVFVFDIGCEIFVFVGKNASKAEKAGGMDYANRYCTIKERSHNLPVTQIIEGSSNETFNSCFDRE